MFTKKQRITLSTISVLLGLFIALVLDIPVGWLFLLCAAFLMYGYFRYQPIWTLAYYVSTDQLAQAEKALAEITPDTLPSDQRAYYDFALGWWTLREGDSKRAQQLLTQALSVGLRTSNDMALTHALLARALLQDGAYQEARQRLDEAKTFRAKPLAAQEIESIEHELQAAQVQD